jgi:hypothetical protein
VLFKYFHICVSSCEGPIEMIFTGYSFTFIVFEVSEFLRFQNYVGSSFCTDLFRLLRYRYWYEHLLDRCVVSSNTEGRIACTKQNFKVL